MELLSLVIILDLIIYVVSGRGLGGGRSETGVVDKLQKNRFEVDKIHRKNYNEFIECYKNYIESFYVFYKSVLKICVIANYRIL